MGTVEVFTKARMLAIENGTVVSGKIDVNGDLLLTRKDGTVHNAGQVNPDIATIDETLAGTNAFKAVSAAGLSARTATELRTGLIELATAAEVTAGTDASRAVTSALLRQERKLVSTYTGVIDDGWSGGRPRVTLVAGQNLTGTVSAYLPGNDDQGIIAGAVVLLTRTNLGDWAILNSLAIRPAFMRPVYLQLRSGYMLYTDANNPDGSFGPYWGGWGNPFATNSNSYSGKIEAYMTSTGIVQLHGLLRRINFPGPGSLITTLPIGMRPARDQIFNVMSDIGPSEILVEAATGDVKQVSGSVSYLAVDNVRFRAKSAVDLGMATFVAGAPFLLGGFMGPHTTPYLTGGATDHTFGYTIDTDGVVLFEGALRVIAAYTANADFARMTNLFIYNGTATFICPGSGANRFVRYGSSNGTPAGTGSNGNFLIHGTTMAVGQWFSMSHLVLLDPASNTTPTIIPSGLNGWVEYGGGWRVPGFATTPDGFALSFGLWAKGTMGSPLTWAPVGSRSKYKRILTTMSADVLARVDIGNPTLNGEYEMDGQIIPLIGTNTWLTMDGLSWVAHH